MSKMPRAIYAIIGGAGGWVFGTALVELPGKKVELRQRLVETEKANSNTGEEIQKEPRPSGDFRDAIKKANDALIRFKEERGVPGISVGVSVKGNVVWKQGYGYSDVENLIPCTSDSSMRIASISKSMTMTLVAKLMQENRLDLDVPVQKYVPNFPEKNVDGEKVSITTRHLVTHTSGIRHYDKSAIAKRSETTVATTPTTAIVDQKSTTTPTEKKSAAETEAAVQQQKAICEKCQRPLNENVPQIQTSNSEFEESEYYSQKQYDSVTDALSMFKDDPLLSKPGTKFSYTTHGWTLVSAVIEGASGEKFPKLFKQLCDVFGLRQTFFDNNQPLIPNRARYYRRGKGQGRSHCLENVPSVNNSYKWAGGGVVSTVGDLLKFANTLSYFYRHCPGGTRATDCYLNRKTLDQIWTPPTSPSIDKGSVSPTPLSTSLSAKYAMGWSVSPDPTLGNEGRFFVSHGGGAVGASSVLLLEPSGSEVAVVVLTNVQECGGLQQLALVLAEIFDRASNLMC